MPYHAPSRELAERAAAKLNASDRIGKPATSGQDRTTTRFVVERYAKPGGQYRCGMQGYSYECGVVERWTYNDRPDLPEMGGAFFDLTPEMWD